MVDIASIATTPTTAKLPPPSAASASLLSTAAPENANANNASQAATDSDTAAAATSSAPSFAATLKEKLDKPATPESKKADAQSANDADPASADAAAAAALSGMVAGTLPPVAQPPLTTADTANAAATTTAAAATALAASNKNDPAYKLLLPADAVTPAPTFFAGMAANPAKATKTAGQNSAAADAKTFAQHAALADTANAQNAPTLSAEAARHDKLATETAVSAASVTNSVANSVTNSAANSAINAAGLTTHGGNVADNAATVATSDATSPLAAAFLPGAQAIDHHAPLNQVPTITASPNQPGWADDLGQRLTWMIGNHRQQADLVLSPPQLGHLQISLKLDGDQATASFVSPHPAVRDALENALPRLREVLAQSGVTLGQTHVGSEQRQFANQPQDAAVSRSAASAVAQTYPGGSQVISSTVGIAGSRGSGMVDTFA